MIKNKYLKILLIVALAFFGVNDLINNKILFGIIGIVVSIALFIVYFINKEK